MSRERGHVKWFSSEKGYGFIERDGKEDVFVHHSQISMDGFRTLDAGEPVEFEIMAGDRGPKAKGVLRMAEHAHAAAPADGRNGRAASGRSGSKRERGKAEKSSGFLSQVYELLFGRLTKQA